MPTIKSEEQLKAVLNSILLKATSRVAEQALFHLTKNIDKYVTGQDSDWYKPTGEFAGAWDWVSVPGSANQHMRKIFYDFETMSVREEGWVHYSHFKKWGDSRKYLADILNKKGFTSSLEWKYSRGAYWDITMTELFDYKLLDDWFDRYILDGLRKA